MAKRLSEVLKISNDDYPTFLALARLTPSDRPAGQISEPLALQPPTLHGSSNPLQDDLVELDAPVTQVGRVMRPRKGLLLIAAAFSLLAIALIVVVLFQSGSGADSDLRLVTLVEDQPRVRFETGQETISSGDAVKVGEVVTVTFKIINNDSRPVRIKSLAMGARGPEVKKEGWGAATVDFPAVFDLTLPPGGTYEYKASRTFSLPGDYFIEPVMQDILGHWGGIQPFTRTEFFVIASNGGHAAGTKSSGIVKVVPSDIFG